MNDLHSWVITVNMPGYLPQSDGDDSFDASPEDAITALLDEAMFQLDGGEDDGEVWESDVAFVQSLDSWEGREDLGYTLREHGSVGFRLESYANGFGCFVTLTRAGKG